jgi:hypothetical protein
MRNILFILICVLWVLGGRTSAAQQEPQSQPPAQPLGPCELVTKAEIEQAIGLPVENGLPREGEKKNVEYCAFHKGHRVAVGLFISRTKDERDFHSLLARTKEVLPHAKVREVPCLGDTQS